MSKQLFITHHDATKTTVALFENGRLVDFLLETEGHRSKVGNIYRGKVRRVVPEMQAIFVDIGLSESGFLAARDAGNAANQNETDLKAIFREGQTVWVQVSKDSLQSIDGLETKGVRLSTELSIETAHIVYLPNNHSVRLSKQIEDEQQRKRYKEALENVIADKKIIGGFIVRSLLSEVANAGDQSWLNDAETLSSKWQVIKQAMQESKKIGLVHQSPNLIYRLIHYAKTEQVNCVFGESSLKYFFETKEPSFEKFFKELTENELASKLSGYHFNEQLKQALEPLVKLPNGGSIVIEKTEALTAIDVNMGSAIQNHVSILSLNLAAAQTIAQQLRLRNLSGMIIIDFINMSTKKENDTLLKKIRQLMGEDSVRIQVYGYTRLGLIELSRERISLSLSSMLTT